MTHDKRIQKIEADIKAAQRESDALTESHRASAAVINRQIGASQERVVAAQTKVQKARAAFFDKHGYWP